MRIAYRNGTGAAVLCFGDSQHIVVQALRPFEEIEVMRAGARNLCGFGESAGSVRKDVTMDSPSRCKKVAAALIAILLLCLLAACGPVLSIHPLYTDRDVVFDPGLVGIWFDPGSSDAPVVFERGPDNSYRVITHLDKDTSADQIFEAHLVKLNGHLFLDAEQTKNRIAGKEEDMGIAIPAHLLGRVSIEGDALNLDLLDEDWIKDQLKAGKISIAHEDNDDGDVVLTASTAELQKFVVAHADDDKAFPNSGPLQRKK